MAVDIKDIEGFDSAEQQQEEAPVGGDYGPRLHNKDKERMADANVCFDILEIQKVAGSDKFRKKGTAEGDPSDFFWGLRCVTQTYLDFAPVPGTDNDKGRAEALLIEPGEEFQFILSNNAKRRPVMEALYAANLDDARTGGTGTLRTIQNVCLVAAAYTKSGSPVLSISKWTEGKRPGLQAGAAAQ